MEVMRLVVTGAVGSGKTTFIRTISEIDVVDTDRMATDDLALWKETTTVALDFGTLQFAPGMNLHLYGTPGQARFDFMWDILIRKAHAYIVLVAAHRPHQFQFTRDLIEFMDGHGNIPMVIGITHTDCEDALTVKAVTKALGYEEENNQVSILCVNCNETASVSQALIVLLQKLMETSKIT